MKWYDIKYDSKILVVRRMCNLQFLDNKDLNYGLLERAKGEGLYGMYSINHTRKFVFLTLIISFFYGLGVTGSSYSFDFMNYHYWFFVIVFVTTVIPLHLIGIPFSLSKKSVYKVQNILYVLKMNYMFFVLSFFTVVPFLNQGNRRRVNTEMFINNRYNYMKITFTFLIVLMCIMIILSFFYVRRQVLAGIYSKKRYYSDYVVIPGVKSRSAYSLWTILGFQVFLTSFVGKTFGTFEISIIFSIVLLYCFSFLFIENIFVLYLKIKFKLKENISVVSTFS